MILNITLSTESIADAISKLQTAKENLALNVGEAVDLLLLDGEMVANSYYGSMATASGQRDSEDNGIVQGHIGVTADDPDTAIIAEFGAGDATIGVAFENMPDVNVYPGAYSEDPIKGKRQYADKGKWYFGGKEYTEVEPRMGLFKAKQHIIQNGLDLAKGVIRLD